MESKIIKQAKHKGRIIKKWFLRTIYILFGIYFIIDFTLFFVATPILKTYLQDKVSKQTQGLFSVDFENISIEMASRRMVLKKFELIPDSAVYDKLVRAKKDVPALYKITCNAVELWHTSVYNIIFKSRLKASQLKLIDLVIELQQLPGAKNADSDSRDFVHEDLYPSISPYLSEIMIDEINVVNGKFNLDLKKDKSKKTTHVGYVSIHLYKFLLNQQEFKKRNRLFFADDLQINIDEYKINLSDKLHYVYAQDLNISTKESRLTARNSGIAPISLPGKSLEKFDNNYYKFHAPFIEIDHFNIYELYFNQDINIGKVFVKKPKFNIYNVLNNNKIKSTGLSKSKELDFSKLITGKLNSVRIDTFQIEAGVMNFFVNHINEKPTYLAKSLSLALYHFELDQNSENNQYKILYANDIVLNIDGFSTLLPDKVHELKVESINVSTFDRNFNAKGIKLQAINLFKGNSTSLNIDVPFLEISGTDFFKLYHHRIFDISNLIVGRSSFDLSFVRKSGTETEDGQRKNFLSLITSNYLNKLSIANFRLNESKFNIKNRIDDSTTYQYQGETSFALSHFEIDENSLTDPDSKLFYSDQFKLKLNNYQQDLKDLVHQLYSKTIEVSTTDSIIEITGLKIHKNEDESEFSRVIASKWIYDFNLIQVQIKGIDINKAYNDSILSANSISVFRPQIKIENNLQIRKHKKANPDTINSNKTPDSLVIATTKKVKEGTIKDLLASYFTQIHLNNINVDNADFAQFEVDSLENRSVVNSGILSAKMNEFHLLPADSVHSGISYSKDLSFRINDYFGKLFDKKFLLKIKQAKFSSKDSSFWAALVFLFPNPDFEKLHLTNNFWTFYAPEITTSKTDISEFLNSNVLDLGFIKFKNPNIINTRLINSDTISFFKTVSTERKPFIFNKVKCSGVIIENGNLGMSLKDGNSENPVLTSKLEMVSDSFEIDSSSVKNLRQLISGFNSTIKLKNINYLMPDSLHFASLKSLNINTQKRTINGDSLNFSSLLRHKGFHDKKGLEELSIPSFSFSGLSFDKLILDKSVLAQKLKISNPDIGFLSAEKSSEKKAFSFDSLDLYRRLNRKLKAIVLDTIDVENAVLRISQTKEYIEKPKVFKNLYVDIQSFIVDSANRNKTKILNSDDVKVKIKDYQHDFSNNLYSMYFKELGISTGQNSLFANGIYFNPNRNRNEYANSRQKETSLLYLKATNLNANGFDVKEFVEQGSIKVKDMFLDEVRFHAYKNKQFPIDSIPKPLLPYDFVLKSSKLIKIDTINLTNSYFSNEVLEKNAKEPGFIELTNINGSIYNLTNSPKAIENDENISFVASAYFMDKSLLTTSFHFPLGSGSEEYYFGGQLDSFDVKDINPLLENSFFVSVADGTVYNMDFNIEANNDYADGQFFMKYKNLKIELLNKKKSDSLNTDKRGLFSMVANSVIRHSNPKHKRGFAKGGRVYYERNIYKTVYNYWISAVVSGMKSTLGFKSKQLKERLKFEKHTKKSEHKKSKKEKRQDKIHLKQIQKEIKQEQRVRKKTEKKLKKESYIEPQVNTFFIPDLNELKY